MLKLTNITIKRGELTVADNINVSFEQGKVYTILGPNGTGKSSMLKTIFGELPHEGQIDYQGHILEHSRLADWRKPIGYMPQDSRVDASLTALEVVVLGRMDSLTMHISDELLTEAATIMTQLGIGHLAHRDVLNLSGGQRQMVMFAQVLLRQPKILMLDEPVSALDMHHQLNLLEEVCRYTKEQNLITIMVLHDLSLAAQFSDEVILLGEGKLQGKGNAHEVFKPEIINRLYRVNVELLYCSNGLPVVRPQRHFAQIR
ncbi:ABC transporter ATP-binding protein [Aggregatibacter kilianii]|uniref:ABC transporter ATP-binding protein n=1 Tax=Aggregatibacter kilianii TaxID=2025884 RepID=UPI000D64E53F|nr:ABC transporter ATP-binding protein [Aggregatibacter kilianii]